MMNTSNNAGRTDTPQTRSLIIYFTMTGNTQKVAEIIQNYTAADIIRLETEVPYPDDYKKSIAISREEKNANARPKLKTEFKNLDKYDTIYLGYPNWMATMPMPFFTLLENYNFAKKTIIPFCTHGRGGIGTSIQDIKNSVQNATVLQPLVLAADDMSELESKVTDWLSTIAN